MVDVFAVLDYIRSQDMDEIFQPVTEEQASALRELGVKTLEDPLPVGQGYVYQGQLTFQMTGIGPVLIQL
jgi:hypothetical protein